MFASENHIDSSLAQVCRSLEVDPIPVIIQPCAIAQLGNQVDSHIDLQVEALIEGTNSISSAHNIDDDIGAILEESFTLH